MLSARSCSRFLNFPTSGHLFGLENLFAAIESALGTDPVRHHPVSAIAAFHEGRNGEPHVGRATLSPPRSRYSSLRQSHTTSLRLNRDERCVSRNLPRPRCMSRRMSRLDRKLHQHPGNVKASAFVRDWWNGAFPATPLPPGAAPSRKCPRRNRRFP